MHVSFHRYERERVCLKQIGPRISYRNADMRMASHQCGFARASSGYKLLKIPCRSADTRTVSLPYAHVGESYNCRH